jgi:glutaredoxin
MTTVTLYAKPGCKLCEEVEDVILDVRDRRPFQFVVRNILQDLADYENYKHDIPVVVVDGAEIARHRMTAEQLERALSTPHNPAGG